MTQSTSDPSFASAFAQFPQLPGMSSMQDALAFVKNMWGGGMPLPGMAMPSLSVDGVNRQIAELKAVESWLTLNMTMLRGTIQALEVQSATLSTLQTMGETMKSAVQPAADALRAQTTQMPAAFFNAVMPDQGNAAATSEKPAEKATHTSPTATPTASQMPFASPASTGQIWQSESPFSFAPPTADKPPAPEAETASDKAGAAPASSSSASAESAAIPPFANPAAWWNLLQDQFRQAVETAAASVDDLAVPAKKSSARPATPKKAAPKAAAKAPVRSAGATAKKSVGTRRVSRAAADGVKSASVAKGAARKGNGSSKASRAANGARARKG